MKMDDREAFRNQGAGKEGPVEKQPEGMPEVRDEEEMICLPHKELLKLKEEKEHYFDRLLRLQADFENYKKRTQKEFQTCNLQVIESFTREILPVIDNFERALESWSGPKEDTLFKGVQLIYQQMMGILGGQGVKPFSSLGKPFDPHKHEALMKVPSPEHPENLIIEEIQKGYSLHDKVIRPALVTVSAGRESDR